MSAKTVKNVSLLPGAKHSCRSYYFSTLFFLNYLLLLFRFHRFRRHHHLLLSPLFYNSGVKQRRAHTSLLFFRDGR